MINPNILKLVTVIVADDMRDATYQGYLLPIHDMYLTKRPGKRRMWLRYSICNNCYYLRSR